MARRHIIFFSLLFICCSPKKNDDSLVTKYLRQININDSSELFITSPLHNKSLPSMYLINKNEKDTVMIGSLNASIECKPQNIIFTNTTSLLHSNYFIFNKYFIYIIGNDEPFPTNTIFIFDMNKKQFLSPDNRILNQSNNIGYSKIYVTGFFSRIDTTNGKVETILRWNTKDILYFSWDIEINKLDSLLLENKWTDISIDSITSLSDICNFAQYKIKGPDYERHRLTAPTKNWRLID